MKALTLCKGAEMKPEVFWKTRTFREMDHCTASASPSNMCEHVTGYMCYCMWVSVGVYMFTQRRTVRSVGVFEALFWGLLSLLPIIVHDSKKNKPKKKQFRGCNRCHLFSGPFGLTVRGFGKRKKKSCCTQRLAQTSHTKVKPNPVFSFILWERTPQGWRVTGWFGEGTCGEGSHLR